MIEPRMFAPPLKTIGEMMAIPGVKAEPIMLVTQEGVAGESGPEQAGAILMLQMSFIDQEHADSFWGAALPLFALLAKAPGFIRRYTLGQERCGTLIALWRTAQDARAFAATPEHRAAVKNLYRERWQYSHFSAIWEVTSNSGRVIFCTECDAVTPVSSGSCTGCGEPLFDVYKTSVNR